MTSIADSPQNEQPSTYAPSEKHLEDWIVANPQYVIPDFTERYNSYAEAYSYFDYIVARQAKLPSGIPDLIVKRVLSVSVIEIKKGVIDANTIVQCLRYMNDLKAIAIQVLYEYWQHGYTPEGWDNSISGAVIGHHVSDRKVLLAADAAGLSVITYKYHGDTHPSYTFYSALVEETPQDLTAFDEWSSGAIGQAIRDVVDIKTQFMRGAQS